MRGDWTVVTGAASGMGMATALRFQADGRRLLLCDRNADALAVLASTGAFADDTVRTLAADITAIDFGDRLGAALGDARIAALVHCAGLSPTMGSASTILSVNFLASIALVDAARPLMAEGGAIVLFASTAGHMIGTAFDEALAGVIAGGDDTALLALATVPEMGYALSKRGVHLLARIRAKSLGTRGVRIVSLSPGIIDTPMGRVEAASQPMMQGLVDNAALPRRAEADEIAAVATFLAGPDASFITGTDILVDGGSLAAEDPVLSHVDKGQPGRR